jgi:hypothetical protein
LVPTASLDQFALRRTFKDHLFIGPTSLRLTTTDLKMTWEDALDRLFAALRDAKKRLEGMMSATPPPTQAPSREQRRVRA